MNRVRDPTLIHLDTDFGGDPDDACALAMVLGWPGVEIVGITTTIDPDGLRAAQVRYLLDLAGRTDIPVVAGAAVSMTTGLRADPVRDDERFWPRGLWPVPAVAGAALDLLERNIRLGARLIAIGPLTNLALLERRRPGALATTSLTAMGGWLDPPAPGLPAWGPEMDFNVQWDPRAVEIVAAAANRLTLATLPATLNAPLREEDLPRLRAAGPVGTLLARQSVAHALEKGLPELGRSCFNLPDDLLNFHYDPVACAVALAWPGVTIEEHRLSLIREGAFVRFRRDPAGTPTRVLVDIDRARFRERWLTAIEAIAPRTSEQHRAPNESGFHGPA